MKSSPISLILSLGALLIIANILHSCVTSPQSSVQGWELAKIEDPLRKQFIQGASLTSKSERPLYFGMLRSNALIILSKGTSSSLNVDIKVPKSMISCLKTGCNLLVKFDSGPIEKFSYSTGGYPMSNRVRLENPQLFYERILSSKQAIMEIELLDFSTQQFYFELYPIPNEFRR